jgi:hypothetical protein
MLELAEPIFLTFTYEPASTEIAVGAFVVFAIVKLGLKDPDVPAVLRTPVMWYCPFSVLAVALYVTFTEPKVVAFVAKDSGADVEVSPDVAIELYVTVEDVGIPTPTLIVLFVPLDEHVTPSPSQSSNS